MQVSIAAILAFYLLLLFSFIIIHLFRKGLLAAPQIYRDA